MKLLSLLLFPACLFGQSATLTLTADGTQPMTYAWLKNGTPIAGATASKLVLSPLKSTDSGAYTATALNAAGSATSGPLNLVVTAATTAAVDFSKQYVEASLPVKWDPPVGQWQTGFVVVPIKKVLDPGAHWDDTQSVYTVGTGEDGIYEVMVTLRAADNPPAFVSVGIAAGADNLDGNKTVWDVSPSAPASVYVHWGMQATVRRSYPAGAKIRCNLFVSSAFPVWGYDVVVRRLQ